MKKEEILIILDNGHGENTPGKCSPDKKVLEWKWCREMVDDINNKLVGLGYKTHILVPEKRDISITERVNRVNKLCKTNKCILISVHINAAGNGTWGSANGWSVFCSKNASTNSKKLAGIMTDYGISHKMMGNRSIPKEKFWTWSWRKDDIGILANSNCPAVLTENFFMDNKNDVQNYLLGEEGRLKIINLHINSIINYVDSLK